MTKENVIDEIRFIADQLAEHAFEKHIGEFTSHQQICCDKNGKPLFDENNKVKTKNDRDLGVTTKEGMREYIQNFLNAPNTQGLIVTKNHSTIVFYNKQDNMIAVIGRNGDDIGTIFRPKRGIHGKLKSLKREAKNNTGQTKLTDGGYPKIREAAPKKSIFNNPDTNGMFQLYLKHNGRTPIKETPPPEINNSDIEKTMAFLADPENIAFITQGDVPQLILFNDTHRKLLIASSETHDITDFKENGGGYATFDDLMQKHQHGLNEEIPLLTGTFADIKQEFAKQTKSTIDIDVKNPKGKKPINDPLYNQDEPTPDTKPENG